MTLVLGAGGVSALAGDRARLRELLDRGLLPAHIPAVVLVEALTGDHRRDFHVNHLVRACEVRATDEIQGREAARLRAATGRADRISAVDAVVVAMASQLPDATVLTSDPSDIAALAEHTAAPLGVAAA